MGPTEDDARFMRAALSFGRRSMGVAAPNPAVGALVVRNGIVVGRGVTAPGGRPHAEPIALAEAGDAARGATLYVTLEPCSHHGHTPPCVEAVLAAGIARVVVAIRDPDLRVAGRGMATLRSAGLDICEGVGAAESLRDHQGHIHRVSLGRPTVTVKLAETADGFAASGPGEPRVLITGPLANAYVHRLRALHDAVMIGRGTAIADDPLLTVRLPGLEDRRPLRVVLDSRAALSLASRLVATARQHPVLLVVAAEAEPSRLAALEAAGVSLCRLPGQRLDLADVLAALGVRGLTRVLCEGGPALASGLIMDRLADSVVMLTGPKRLSGSGLPALTAAARARLESPAAFALVDDVQLGPDGMRTYERVET